MKIRITLEIDVDPVAWCQEYGMRPDEVADDVRSYVLTQMQHNPLTESGVVTGVRPILTRDTARARASQAALDALRDTPGRVDLARDVSGEAWARMARQSVRLPLATKRLVDWDWVRLVILSDA